MPVLRRRDGASDAPGEAVLSRPADAECPDLRVWPTADVLAIFRFHADDEVDVDLRELEGQSDLMCSAASSGRSDRWGR